MTIATCDNTIGVSFTVVSGPSPELFHRLVRVYEEESADGKIFSAEIAALPGVTSQGSSIDECVENLMEAFAGACAEFDSKGIPWTDSPSEPADEPFKELWILMDG